MRLLLILILLFSCARTPTENRTEAMRPADIPATLNDDLPLEEFIAALKTNIRILKNQKDREMVFGSKTIAASDYAEALQRLVNYYLSNKNKDEFMEYLRQNFEWNEVYGRDKWGEIMLTSYYEPLYPGRTKPVPPYIQPIYGLPKDLIEIDMELFEHEHLGDFETKRRKVGARLIKNGSGLSKAVPFYSREEIDIKKELKKRKLELYYLDPIHAFFLQIQGSGIVELPNGRHVRVGYAGQNGYAYESIGKHLYDVIPKDEMSLQKIEAHLRTLSQDDLYNFLKINPSYVFFKKLENGRGRTTFGSEVVSGRTLAVDSQLFSLGSLGYLSFQKPQFGGEDPHHPASFIETSRLVIAQDTGGAIKTAGRADLFWGEGSEALLYAGNMRHEARLWFLTPIQTR